MTRELLLTPVALEALASLARDPGRAGLLKQVRKTDGFHLNTDGVNYLARNVLDVIIAELKARGAAI